MKKTALLIVDMQKGCKVEASRESIESATEYINYMSRIFRENVQPVIVIQDVGVGEGPGSVGFEVLDEIEVSDQDIIVHKRYNNAFCETELDSILKEKEVGLVVVCGFAADYCVLFTYNGAREHNYCVSLLQHGIAGCDADEVKNTQLKRPVISHEALEYFLK